MRQQLYSQVGCVKTHVQNAILTNKKWRKYFSRKLYRLQDKRSLVAQLCATGRSFSLSCDFTGGTN
jgi:hypothetical protein